ncbi:MAG TPA: SMI1/KNR4 family protein [Pirellulales bacterium]
MAISELVAVVPPPQIPRETGPWSSLPNVERRLGTKLPKDIIDLGQTYGTGSFAGNVITVFNPFSGRYVDDVELFSGIYRQLSEAEGKDAVPYPLFPKKSGLLIWGRTASGNAMFWRTIGEPDEWPIVLLLHGGFFEEWKLSVTTFLAKVLSKEMECILFSKEWVRENSKALSFSPR